MIRKIQENVKHLLPVLVSTLVLLAALTSCGNNRDLADKESVGSETATENDSVTTEESEEYADNETMPPDEMDVSETEETAEQDKEQEQTQNPTAEKVTDNGSTETLVNTDNKVKPTEKPTEKQTEATTAVKEATTAQTTTPYVPKETEKHILEFKEEKKASTLENIKYGVKKSLVQTEVYAIFSDGSRELAYTYSDESIDVSGYNATDDDLKAESQENAVKYRDYAQKVLKLVNDIRAKAGVEPLVLDDNMCKAASMRAIEMNYANYFEHRRANGDSCFSVLPYFGVSSSMSGENIGAGYGSPEEVVEGWKNSPGHYANMTEASFKKLGVGYSSVGIGDYGTYWVQLFTD